MNLLHDALLIAPLILIALGGCALMLLESFVKPQSSSRPKPNVLDFCLFVSVLAALLLHLLLGLQVSSQNIALFSGALSFDMYTWFVSFLILAGSGLSLLLTNAQLSGEGIHARAEYHALFLFCIAGALIFVAAADFLVMFLGLEIMSMALYCLCGSIITEPRTEQQSLATETAGSAKQASLRTRSSAEAAMKYFFLGSFSSAFFLYGVALIYGLTGSLSLIEIGKQLGQADPTLVLFAIGLVIVGLAFKIGLVPFHFWAPDVYQGSPTSLSGFMATVVKISAVTVALRVLWVAFGVQMALWSPMIWVIAVCSMTLANLAALRQLSLKRMLAYSSIAHAGYLMMGFLVRESLAGEAQPAGGAAVLFYLIAYTVMTLGAFAVVLMVTTRSDGKYVSDDLANFNGLASKKPWLAALMSLFMLSLAGIPPGLAGLMGKIFLFSAALKGGYVGLVILAALNSAVSCYYYLRVIVAMYFKQSSSDDTFSGMQPGTAGLATLGICAAAVLLLGLFPGQLLESVAYVSISLAW
jgi:NADH-quinone oxidoreductase subunit N